MNISVDTIYEFHRVRTACHVASVNYFADILGFHFPEHDNDKNLEPMRTGYAYKNYAKYHKNYNMLPMYSGLFEMAHAAHHRHASHHIEFYGGNVAMVPNVCLVEMICDWFSANFEQKYILHDGDFDTVHEWFNAKMRHHNWTRSQLKIISDAIDYIEQNMDIGTLMKIWEPVQERAEL